MIDLVRFICGWIRVVILILRPGGVKAIAAENMVLRQQLISLSRQHKRSPKLNTLDRIMFGMLASWINPRRLSRSAITSNQLLSLSFIELSLNVNIIYCFPIKHLKNQFQKDRLMR